MPVKLFSLFLVYRVIKFVIKRNENRNVNRNGNRTETQFQYTGKLNVQIITKSFHFYALSQHFFYFGFNCFVFLLFSVFFSLFKQFQIHNVIAIVCMHVHTLDTK